MPEFTQFLTNPVVLIAVAVNVGAAVRWLYRYVRNAEVQKTFVEDMATNHLPHIYHALEMLCAKQGVELKDPPPPIRFIKFDGKE